MSLPIRLEPTEGYDFAALAMYNGERARGIVHTPEWDALMAKEQARFNEEQRAEWIAKGGHPLNPDDPDGAWMIPGPPMSRWELLWLRLGDVFRR